MAYFQELPNISYPSLLPSSSKAEDRIIVKNIFRRSKLRTDVDQSITAFNYYYVQEKQRPDIQAQDLYGDSELDWVILTTNNITNIRDQWPLDHNDLHDYMLEKYGSQQNIAGIHHYETKKIVDEYEKTIEIAAENYSPAIIANYCYDLAKEYSQFYASHNILNEEDNENKLFRLNISSQVGRVLSKGLQLLGIEVPDRMQWSFDRIA